MGSLKYRSTAWMACFSDTVMSKCNTCWYFPNRLIANLTLLIFFDLVLYFLVRLLVYLNTRGCDGRLSDTMTFDVDIYNFNNLCLIIFFIFQIVLFSI